MYDNLFEFIKESNRIEGIKREPTEEEMNAAAQFLGNYEVDIDDVIGLVKVFQPDARLRDKKGLNVRVGAHVPIPGGPEIRVRLTDIIREAYNYHGSGEMAYHLHHSYETLHPFTDGNGRSGRMLWLWMMQEAPLGFLHTWYYQSLQYGGSR